jgi:hypothetical protein
MSEPDGFIEVRPAPRNAGFLAAMAGWDPHVPAGYSRNDQREYLGAYASGVAYRAGMAHGQAGRGQWTNAELGDALTWVCGWIPDEDKDLHAAEYRRGLEHGRGMSL